MLSSVSASIPPLLLSDSDEDEDSLLLLLMSAGMMGSVGVISPLELITVLLPQLVAPSSFKMASTRCTFLPLVRSFLSNFYEEKNISMITTIDVIAPYLFDFLLFLLHKNVSLVSVETGVFRSGLPPWQPFLPSKQMVNNAPRCKTRDNPNIPLSVLSPRSRYISGNQSAMYLIKRCLRTSFSR